MATNRTLVDRARSADIAVLVDLMAEFHAEAGYPLDRPWAEASFRRLFLHEYHGAAWIARAAGDHAGYIVLTLRHSMEFGGLTGTIDDFFVRPGSRRRGIGSKLLDALFAECHALAAVAVEVEVGIDNVAAGEAYQRFGLRPGGKGRETLMVLLAG